MELIGDPHCVLDPGTLLHLAGINIGERIFPLLERNKTKLRDALDKFALVRNVQVYPTRGGAQTHVKCVH